MLAAAVVASLVACFSLTALHAQQATVRGYITAVQPPDGFDVNGEHVITSAETAYGLIGSKAPGTNAPARDAVTVGAWVEVVGDHDRSAKTVTARSVLFRDGAKHKIVGLGMIFRVISTSPDLEIDADGYRIRANSTTEINLPKDMKSAAEVRAGQLVLYEGKLDQDGTLIAGKLRILRAKDAAAQTGATPDAFVAPANAESAAQGSTAPPDNILCQTGDEKIGGDEILLGDYTVRGYPTYRISRDRNLQSRVRHIGMSLVPAYQNQLTAEAPSKIQFLFCAVEDRGHEEIISAAHNQLGWVFVPTRLAARFRNDDQLAAVLADGIALSLQKQAPAFISDDTASLLETAGLVGANFVPLAGIPIMAATDALVGPEINRSIDEQRARIGLQLMAEAGYDPWQAPEAWRLAGPSKLPADISTLKYPDKSDYQLRVLNLMYKKHASADAATNGSTANGDTSRNRKP